MPIHGVLGFITESLPNYSGIKESSSQLLEQCVFSEGCATGRNKITILCERSDVSVIRRRMTECLKGPTSRMYSESDIASCLED